MPAQPDTAADRLARIQTILSGEPAERDKARWQALVLDVVRDLERLTPMRKSFPALLDGVTTEALRKALRAAEPDPVLMGAFIQWRADVTYLELTNGKRLRSLATALAMIRELQARGRTEEQLSRFAEAIRQHLAFVWHLPPPTAQEAPRDWSDKHARRMDLLPASWRSL